MTVKEMIHTLLPAVQSVKQALSTLGMRAKITVPFTPEILFTSMPPSAGRFEPGLAPVLEPLLQCLNETDSPFMVNVFPYFLWVYNQAKTDLKSALAKPTAVPTWDGNLVYSNLFDAQLDAVYAALDR